MDLTLWITFALSYLALCLVPGPSVAVVVGQAIAGGFRSAGLCILGDMGAAFMLIVISFFGIGALLALSATVFVVLKWAGVLYMAALGVLMIRDARAVSEGITIPVPTAQQSLRAGFLTGIFNPKGIAFYAAFLAQFIDPTKDTLPQLMIILATVLAIMAATLSIYAFAATTAREVLNSAKAQRRMRYGGGVFLLGGSAILATERAA